MLFPFDSSSMAPLLAFVLTLGCSSIDASELGCVPAEADDGELQRGPVVVATTDGTPVVEYENSYALLVGVTRYQEGWGAIESIPQELSLVRDVLEEHRFEVELTLDPNEAEMRSTIEVFIDTHGFNERNRLLIYFAGHGQRLEFEDGVRGYLVPADAPWPSREKVRFLRSAIDFNEIIALMRKITARHVLFVFGSCYSGVIERRHGDRWHCDHGDRWARGPSRAFDAG